MIVGEHHTWSRVRITGVSVPKCLSEGCEEPGIYPYTIPFLVASTGEWHEWTSYWCDEHWPGRAREEALARALLEGDDGGD